MDKWISLSVQIKKRKRNFEEVGTGLKLATRKLVKLVYKECGPKNEGVRAVSIQNEIAYHREKSGGHGWSSER